jgi:hypothetical protein
MFVSYAHIALEYDELDESLLMWTKPQKKDAGFVPNFYLEDKGHNYQILIKLHFS